MEPPYQISDCRDICHTASGATAAWLYVASVSALSPYFRRHISGMHWRIITKLIKITRHWVHVTIMTFSRSLDQGQGQSATAKGIL